jgi:translocation and assembly module TamB
MRRTLRIALKLAAALTVLLTILAIAGVLVLRSGWFHEKVRERIVTEIERVTGGSATLGNFAFDWGLLTVEFRDLTLRGKEPVSAAPLLHAKSIVVGLKIVSLLKKDVDVQSVVVREPQVDVIVAPDGSTNIPEPKISRKTGGSGIEPLLDWKIADFALEGGAMLLAEKKMALDVRGQNLHAVFSYDLTGPRYKGQISIQPLEIDTRRIVPLNANVYLTLGLEKNRIDVSQAKIDMQGSYLEASGAIENLESPKGAFRFTAHLAVEQAARLLKIRALRQGTVDLSGSANYTGDSDYSVAASVDARGLDVKEGGIHVAGVRATSSMRLSPRGLTLEAIALHALGGQFTGKADVPGLQRFVVDGTVRGFAIQQTLAALAPDLPRQQRTTWSGVASGPVHLQGRLDGGSILARANLAIAPTPGGIPVTGSIDASYDGRGETLSLGQSHLSTAGIQLDVSGTLGSQLRTRLVSTNLDDLLPAINAFSSQPVGTLPVRLNNGIATFDGAVSGPLSSPQVAGAVTVTSFVCAGVGFDRFSGNVTLSPSLARLQNGALARGPASAQINGTVSLAKWKPGPASAVIAAVAVRGLEIPELLNLAGQKQIPVRGTLAASIGISGTASSQTALADFTIAKGSAYDQPFDRLQANLDYSPQAIKLTRATLIAGPAQITASASFEPTGLSSGVPDLRNGQLQFQVTTNLVAVEQIEIVKRLRPDVTGKVRATAAGSATLRDGAAQFLLTSLDGEVSAHDLAVENRSIGNFLATAKTQAQVLTVQLDSNFLHSNLQANGQWRLVPGYPGEASARFSQTSVETVRQWLGKSVDKSSLNFDGSMEGKISVSGPAVEPRHWKASVNLSKLELFPLDQDRRTPGAQRIVVHNEGPVVATLENSRVSIESAHFSGPSTDIKISGGATLEPKVGLDLRANGDVNLAVLENFDQDLEVTGTVTANASIRGSLDRPQINGQLDVKGASLHLADITTGISGASGTILFNGSRATIQNLTGTVGGGSIKLTGDVGLVGADLSYRVDAAAANVRVRYPEGVSTSANANLSLRGTSQRSTLSGIVTVLRTGFTPRTDFSSILFQASQPVRTPSARVGPLSGMQFDVRIETAPDISFESSFAQDIEVEGSLRLQGTPYNPVLLGRINITEGDINFFGTKFTINQGSITFANPVRLEPVLNLDLETKVQGIDVILTVSGPVNKLNVTPRSDPPLQYSEVVSLLATGSVPSSAPTLSTQQNTPTQNFSELGASALLGQVVANPVSGRLQRFFGVSNVKINPQFAGVENNPQARLTVEQQVTRNITFTYITNLASSNQQIVRVEWALNKSWSLIALRDENGLFGIDFLYKKSFK